jgi:lysophospholipase L1-like esterase
VRRVAGAAMLVLSGCGHGGTSTTAHSDPTAASSSGGPRASRSELAGGRRVSQQVGVSRGTGAGLELLRARGGGLPPIIVVSLGTNDGPDPSRFRGLVEDVLATATLRRCVVLPPILRPGSLGGHSWSDLNRVLAEAADRHPNLRLVQWMRLVRAHPTWLGHDGVHVTVRGYRARAAAIAAAIRTCDQPV